jgi:hypothetical protein
MNIQEQIKRILREDFTNAPNSVRRRLTSIDWEIGFAVKEVTKQYLTICNLTETEYVDTVIEKTIDSMYWNFFSDMDDNSKEWVNSYRLMLKYIEDKFLDKLKEHYHINCGN